MERYGNIRFNRRVVVFVCLLVVAVNFLMPKHVVYADEKSYVYSLGQTFFSSEHELRSVDETEFTLNKPLYFYVAKIINGSSFADGTKLDSYYLCASIDGNYTSFKFPSCFDVSYDKTYDLTTLSYLFAHSNNFPSDKDVLNYWLSVDYCKKNHGASCITWNGEPYIPKNLLSGNSFDDIKSFLAPKIKDGSIDSSFLGNYDKSYKPTDKAYSEIGALDNVQMETYITNKKELINADENADLSKINQDKVIVYSSTSTAGIDLSKGGYKVQLYGSYAWQDKSGNIKSEDKGHKTFIKDWNAENNIKGLNRSNYTWIDWKSANDKVESDKTDNAHKPNVFEKMTTYGNYQFEPIWYLRIVSKDNKYGAWVKLYNSTKKGKYTSEAVDDNDNSVSDSDGGYSKPKDTSEITGTGDTPEDAKNNVQKTEEKQDNKDIQDASGGSNSTFDKLEEFTKGIGDVPKMIADIFSFLPSWCLEVVAIGFALLMILIVVKFIRG